MIETHIYVTISIITHLYLILLRYALPGNDHGSYENPFDTWDVLMNSRNLQLAL